MTHSRTFRAKGDSCPVTGSVLGVCGLEPTMDWLSSFVLANPVNYCASIKTLHPCVSRTVVEKTKICSIPRERARKVEARRYEFASDTESLRVGTNLEFSPGEPGAIHRGCQLPEIAVSEDS